MNQKDWSEIWSKTAGQKLLEPDFSIQISVYTTKLSLATNSKPTAVVIKSPPVATDNHN